MKRMHDIDNPPASASISDSEPSTEHDDYDLQGPTYCQQCISRRANHTSSTIVLFGLFGGQL